MAGCSFYLAPKQICHPDRSAAQWRDLLCAFPPNKGPTSEIANLAAPRHLFGDWGRVQAFELALVPVRVGRR
jgi:hypothetical protein